MLARVVPAGDAHHGGLCRADPVLRAAFAADADNLVYADAQVISAGRRGRGPAYWLPTRNRCWYAHAQLRVRSRYDVSIAPEDAAALEALLASCPLVPEPVDCALTLN